MWSFSAVNVLNIALELNQPQVTNTKREEGAFLHHGIDKQAHV